MALSAATVWRVRPAGSNNNGGGFDSTVAGTNTDYSQRDTPILTVTDAACTTGGVIVTSTTGGFGTDYPGNLIRLSGTHFTTGFYSIQTRTNTNTITVDRDPTDGSNASAGTLAVGGGWATPEANTAANIVGGNIIYVLGGASPSYGAPDYVGVAFVPVSGTTAAGLVRFIGDPNTPANNGFGGKPLISVPGRWANGFVLVKFQDLFLVGAGTTNNTLGVISQADSDIALMSGMIFDQNGYDLSLSNGTGAASIGSMKAVGCEVFTSVAARGGSTQPALTGGHYGIEILFSNIHDCLGVGIAGDTYSHFMFDIIAKNGGSGFTQLADVGQGDAHHNGIEFCTIDGNLGHGIEFLSANEPGALFLTHVFNCTVSNHTQATKYGFIVDSGTAASNQVSRGFIDYNSYFNNTNGNYNAISAGAHDTALGADPYVAQSTENYTLK